MIGVGLVQFRMFLSTPFRGVKGSLWPVLSLEAPLMMNRGSWVVSGLESGGDLKDQGQSKGLPVDSRNSQECLHVGGTAGCAIQDLDVDQA